MNSPSNDSPELTAYALGELSGAQAGDVHELLASLPAALSELEQIEAVTEALRQGAPIPQHRLNPEQRHAILHPTGLPRRIVPMMPRPLQKRRQPLLWPALSSLAKAAAVVALTAVAFSLGRKTSLEGGPTADLASTPAATTKTAAPATAAKAPTPGPLTTAVPVPVPVPVAIAQPVAESAKIAATVDKPAAIARPTPLPEKPAVVVLPAKPAPTVIAQAPVPVAPKPAQAAVPTTPAAAAPKPVAVNVATLGFTTPPRRVAFVNASRKPGDQAELRPAKIRPLPVKADKTQVFASPAPAKAMPEVKDGAGAKARPADLFIHSWKADVFTCPWNEANRLLRVVIQLPADQPAVIAADNAYPLQITFDPNYVREYRMLCERHQLATELRTAGTHVIWYEFQPNGVTEPTREVGKLIATVTLPNARFTTQTVDPFDGSKLRVMDRNQSWQTARPDFVFESSVVGFGMLLRGIPETSKLNHQLVLDLATKAKGADPTGEHARFIRLVQDAKLAAGL